LEQAFKLLLKRWKAESKPLRAGMRTPYIQRAVIQERVGDVSAIDVPETRLQVAQCPKLFNGRKGAAQLTVWPNPRKLRRVAVKETDG